MRALGTDVKLQEEGIGFSLQKWKCLCLKWYHKYTMSQTLNLRLVLRELQNPVVMAKPTSFVLYDYS